MDAQARYDELTGDRAACTAEVELGKMSRVPCVKADGKAACGFWQDSLVV